MRTPLFASPFVPLFAARVTRFAARTDGVHALERAARTVGAEFGGAGHGVSAFRAVPAGSSATTEP